MKKKVALLVVVILSFSLLVGCSETETASASGENDSYTIGVCSPNLDDKFQVYISDEIVANATAAGVKTIVVDAKEDTAKQLGQVENFIVQGVNAIICIPVDTNAAEPIVAAAKAADIPFICVNREIESEDVTAYIGSSDFSAGELQAEILFELSGEETQVGILEGIPGNISGVARIEGFESKISDKPGVVVEGILAANLQRSEAIDVMENWLQSGVELETIIACNDEMAIGASIAIEQEGRTGEFVIIGVDGTPDALAEIKAGKIQGTCFQNPFEQGLIAVEVAIAAIEGKEFERKNYIDFEKVTAANVDDYIKIWTDKEVK